MSKSFNRESYLERKDVYKLLKRIWSSRIDPYNFKLLKNLPPINNPNEFLVSYENLEQLTRILMYFKLKDKHIMSDSNRIFFYRIWNQDYIEYFENKAAIYLIQNKITKKKYIGKTNNLHNRLANYCDPFYISNKKASSNIYRSILKFGYHNFSFTILEHCKSEDLSKREQYFINLLKPQYNIRKVVYTDKKG